MLLNHVRGPTSFESIRSVLGELGLVETDRSLDEALTEATTFQMPSALRRMFATIIVFCEYTNIRVLWDKHVEALGEDYHRVHANSAYVEQLVLRDIADIVRSMGKDIKSYGLPNIDESGGFTTMETLSLFLLINNNKQFC